MVEFDLSKKLKEIREDGVSFKEHIMDDVEEAVKEFIKREETLINDFRLELENELMIKEIPEPLLKIIHFKIEDLKQKRLKLAGENLR